MSRGFFTGYRFASSVSRDVRPVVTAQHIGGGFYRQLTRILEVYFRRKVEGHVNADGVITARFTEWNNLDGSERRLDRVFSPAPPPGYYEEVVQQFLDGKGFPQHPAGCEK